MKKVVYLLAIFSATMLFSSCFDEVDNWYSETVAYDGRFVVATSCEEYSSDDTSIEDGLEVMIYNSAANVKDEIWIDATVAGSSIKGKFKLSGSSSEFVADQEAKNVNSNTYYIDTDYGLAPFTPDYAAYFRTPTSAGELNDGVQAYARLKLKSGKIIPKGATTIGGNTSDSIYLALGVYSDFIQFESYLLPEGQWTAPGVEEYAWKIKEGSNTPATPADWDENWTLSGYRYTGYPEDI